MNISIFIIQKYFTLTIRKYGLGVIDFSVQAFAALIQPVSNCLGTAPEGEKYNYLTRTLQ